jgi:uridylate kinase
VLQFHRVLVKISGEAMVDGSSTSFSVDKVCRICRNIKNLIDAGVNVSVVIGGGNFIRGRDWNNCDIVKSETADAMGMLSTAINGIMLRDALRHHELDSEIVSNLNLPFDILHANSFNISKASAQGKIIIFVGGIGLPYCSTDTVSIIAASLSGCDAILKATTVDGIYTDDPKINKNATYISHITFQEAIDKHLKFMDRTALVMAQQRNIPILVFSINEENCLLRSINNDIRVSTIK